MSVKCVQNVRQAHFEILTCLYRHSLVTLSNSPNVCYQSDSLVFVRVAWIHLPLVRNHVQNAGTVRLPIVVKLVVLIDLFHLNFIVVLDQSLQVCGYQFDFCFDTDPPILGFLDQVCDHLCLCLFHWYAVFGILFLCLSLHPLVHFRIICLQEIENVEVNVIKIVFVYQVVASATCHAAELL